MLRLYVWGVIGIVFVAIIVYWQRKLDQSANTELLISPLETDLGIIETGDHQFPIILTNPSSQTRRILGCDGMCRNGVCITTEEFMQPLDIAPNSTVQQRYHLSIQQVGQFETTLSLYLEDASGLRKVPIIVRGIAVAPGGVHVPAKP